MARIPNSSDNELIQSVKELINDPEDDTATHPDVRPSDKKAFECLEMC